MKQPEFAVVSQKNSDRVSTFSHNGHNFIILARAVVNLSRNTNKLLFLVIKIVSFLLLNCINVHSNTFL